MLSDDQDQDLVMELLTQEQYEDWKHNEIVSHWVSRSLCSIGRLKDRKGGQMSS